MSSKEPTEAENPREIVHVQLLDDKLRSVALIIGGMMILAGAITAIALAWPAISALIGTALPFVVGLVFAYIFNPVVNFVQYRLRLSRVGGVLVLYLIFILAFTAFFAMVLPILVQQIKSAYHGIGGFVETMTHRLAKSLGVGGEGESVDFALIYAQLDAWLQERGIVIAELVQSSRVQTAAKDAAASGFNVAGDALTFFFSVGMAIVGTVTFLVFAVLVNIYLLIDFSKLSGMLQVVVPAKYQPRLFDVLGKLDQAVGGFIRGSITVAAIVGCMTFVGLWLLGLKQYALLIGIVAGFGNLIPYLGAISGATPAVLYILFSDSYETTQQRLIYLSGTAVLFGFIQTVEGFVLQPKIVGQSASLHPLAVLFALALGANFGLVGMILAVPAACIIRVLLKEFYWDRREGDWKERTGNLELADAAPAAKRTRSKKKKK